MSEADNGIKQVVKNIDFTRFYDYMVDKDLYSATVNNNFEAPPPLHHGDMNLVEEKERANIDRFVNNDDMQDQASGSITDDDDEEDNSGVIIHKFEGEGRKNWKKAEDVGPPRDVEKLRKEKQKEDVRYEMENNLDEYPDTFVKPFSGRLKKHMDRETFFKYVTNCDFGGKHIHAYRKYAERGEIMFKPWNWKYTSDGDEVHDQSRFFTSCYRVVAKEMASQLHARKQYHQFPAIQHTGTYLPMCDIDCQLYGEKPKYNPTKESLVVDIEEVNPKSLQDAFVYTDDYLIQLSHWIYLFANRCSDNHWRVCRDYYWMRCWSEFTEAHCDIFEKDGETLTYEAVTQMKNVDFLARYIKENDQAFFDDYYSACIDEYHKDYIEIDGSHMFPETIEEVKKEITGMNAQGEEIKEIKEEKIIRKVDNVQNVYYMMGDLEAFILNNRPIEIRMNLISENISMITENHIRFSSCVARNEVIKDEYDSEYIDGMTVARVYNYVRLHHQKFKTFRETVEDLRTRKIVPLDFLTSTLLIKCAKAFCELNHTYVNFIENPSSLELKSLDSQEMTLLL